MTQLARSTTRRTLTGGIAPVENVCPAGADEIFFGGAFALVTNATGVAVRCTPARLAVANTYSSLGVVTAGMLPSDPQSIQNAARPVLDMTGKTQGTWGDSEKKLHYWRMGTFDFVVAAVGIPRPGAVAYLTDEDTVSMVASTSGLRAGVFVQPSPTAGRWFVDTTFKGA